MKKEESIPMNNPASTKKPPFFRRVKIAYYRHIGDRRRYLRRPLRVKVTEKVSGLFEHFSSTNISAGGMFLRSERAHPVESALELEFCLPGREKVISASAKVVRAVPPGNPSGYDPGMGVEFTRINPEDKKAIEEFVREPGIY